MRYLLFNSLIPEVSWTDRISGRVLDALSIDSLDDESNFNCVVDTRERKISWDGVKWVDFNAGIPYFNP